MSFTLPTLDYSYDALEPNIDAKTMEIHHSKHHAGYTNKLNDAIKGTEFENKSIEQILMSPNIPDSIRNNGGGYFNHCLFWDIICPRTISPSNQFVKIIDQNFGSFDNMKKEFENAASTRFGSGWAWLCSKNSNLSICSTSNQDNPLMDGQCGGVPIMGLDVWEHAYYLKYQNKRPDYINAFWNIINWKNVETRYQASL